VGKRQFVVGINRYVGPNLSREVVEDPVGWSDFERVHLRLVKGLVVPDVVPDVVSARSFLHGGRLLLYLLASELLDKDRRNVKVVNKTLNRVTKQCGL
jgi:hypothetical protein